FQPSFLWQEPLLVAVALGVTALAKPLISALLLVAFKRRARSAVTIGLGRGQLAEFSFILTALGTELDVLPGKAASAVVAASIPSITLNPLLLRFAPRASRLMPESTPQESHADASDPDSDRHRVIVVGYGPIGRTVSRLFHESGLEPSIIELNLE